MAKRVKITSIAKSAESSDEIRNAVHGVTMADVEFRTDSLDRVASSIVNSHAPDVLLVELGLDDQAELETLAGVIRQNAGRLAVIATGESGSLEHIRSLMRLGVTDFLPRPVSRKDLLGALETAISKVGSRAASQDVEEGRVLTFMRASGGAGATTLAVESAAQFGAIRKKMNPSVCLLDFDLQFGNIALALDLPADISVHDVIEADMRLDKDFLKGAMAHHSSGIDVLAAPMRIMPLETMTSEIATRIIHFARVSYDFVIIDMPNAWTSWTLDVLAASDALVMVTELDVTSVARTRRQLDILEDSPLHELPVVVVLNRYNRGWSMRGRRKEAEQGLGRSFDFVIENDFKTAAAARDRGALVSQVRPRSPIVKGLAKFVETIAPQLQRQDRPAASRPALRVSLSDRTNDGD